jgi:hypothetical protein
MVCVLRTMLKHVPKGSGRFGKPGVVFSTQQSPPNKKSLTVGNFGGICADN